MLLRLHVIGFAMLYICSLSSCSDDDMDGKNSSLTINSTTATWNSSVNSCQIMSFPDETDFMATLDYEDDTYSFGFTTPDIKSKSDVKSGKDLTDNITVYRFYRLMGLFWGDQQYDHISGSVKVLSVSNNLVTLEFRKFKFSRELDGYMDDTFTLNGVISYTMH